MTLPRGISCSRRGGGFFTHKQTSVRNDACNHDYWYYQPHTQKGKLYAQVIVGDLDPSSYAYQSNMEKASVYECTQLIGDVHVR